MENAIKHGIAPFRRAGQPAWRARLEAEAILIITVWDSGPGLDEAALERPGGNGVGLRNVDERLARAYGTHGTLQLTSQPGSGTTAELRLPYTEVGVDRRGFSAHHVH